MYLIKKIFTDGHTEFCDYSNLVFHYYSDCLTYIFVNTFRSSSDNFCFCPVFFSRADLSDDFCTSLGFDSFDYSNCFD